MKKFSTVSDCGAGSGPAPMNDAFLSSCFSLLTLTQITILKRLQSARSFFHAMRRRKLIDGMKLSAHEK
jgi:hypothetical protein